jgi:hypothetical protein
MKASELRIWNFFDWSPLASMGRGQDQVTVSNIGYHDLMNPIPITEEWLVKFGFEKDVDDLVLDINTVFFVFYNDGEFVRLKSNHLETITSIQYVHKLQNLYFALTGEELNLTK